MSELVLCKELRPCLVNDKRALLHSIDWIGEILTSVVEYEDGSIGVVNPRDIRFIDNKFVEYNWSYKEGDKND